MMEYYDHRVHDAPTNWFTKPGSGSAVIYDDNNNNAGTREFSRDRVRSVSTSSLDLDFQHRLTGFDVKLNSEIESRNILNLMKGPTIPDFTGDLPRNGPYQTSNDSSARLSDSKQFYPVKTVSPSSYNDGHPGGVILSTFSKPGTYSCGNTAYLNRPATPEPVYAKPHKYVHPLPPQPPAPAKPPRQPEGFTLSYKPWKSTPSLDKLDVNGLTSPAWDDHVKRSPHFPPENDRVYSAPYDPLATKPTPPFSHQCGGQFNGVHTLPKKKGYFETVSQSSGRNENHSDQSSPVRTVESKERAVQILKRVTPSLNHSGAPTTRLHDESPRNTPTLYSPVARTFPPSPRPSTANGNALLPLHRPHTPYGTQGFQDGDIWWDMDLNNVFTCSASDSPYRNQQRPSTTYPYDVTVTRREDEGFGFVIISSVTRSGSTIGENS